MDENRSRRFFVKSCGVVLLGMAILSVSFQIGMEWGRDICFVTLWFWVSMATLHDFARRGCNAAELDTDDFRLPSVKTYLNLGFVPVFTDETHEARWQAVMQNLQS